MLCNINRLASLKLKLETKLFPKFSIRSTTINANSPPSNNPADINPPVLSNGLCGRCLPKYVNKKGMLHVLSVHSKTELDFTDWNGRTDHHQWMTNGQKMTK